MDACMNLSMHGGDVCMHACMYVCMCVCMCVFMAVLLRVCVRVCLIVAVCASPTKAHTPYVYACIYQCIHIAICVSVRINVCTHAYSSEWVWSVQARLCAGASGCAQASQVMEHKNECLAYKTDTRVATGDACRRALPVHRRLCVRARARASVCAHPTVPVGRRTRPCP